MSNNNPKNPVESSAAPRGIGGRLALICVCIVIAVASAAGAYFYLGSRSQPKEHQVEQKTPIFVNLEPLTLNLRKASENDDDRLLQLTITVQVGEKEHEELLKLYMPQVRNRMLLLLSSKSAAQIGDDEGKRQLMKDILAKLREPYSERGPEQRVMNVFLTSFVIQ